MRVQEARQIAREWVNEQGSRTPGFLGAFFHGSVNWLADDADLPAASDLDVMLVLADASPPQKPGKFLYRGVLLEVSYVSWAALQSPQHVLSEYNMAGSFHVPSVILDPTGHLGHLQEAVSAEYAKRRFVEARSRQALDKIADRLQRLEAPAPCHEQVMIWLFATGVMTHVLLVAGLKNPTVRRRYAATSELLAEYGLLDFYPVLLDLLGCENMTQERAHLHLDALANAFDDAANVIRTPFPYASDISGLARPIAIDGSREMISGGQHREAVFWLAVTYSRCRQVFHHDAAPDMQEAHAPGYRLLLSDMGIDSQADLRQRGEPVRATLPQLWSLAEAIMDANPRIEE